ncbi:glycosyltransferase [Microbacterium testaceum]|uniref:glycosyltransferase n=1 Tax=Microbacterium testaceum TaxID=2033 RepID=UPI002AC7DACB|nr:glycosyltransferase [Microbacterium testaceum]MDZ5144086.1 glycosyltransferase [Microbacterium testaceum]
MRIALVTDYYLPTLGGVQTAVKSLREALTRAGHEVAVFCPLAQPSADPSIVALPISRAFRPDGYPFAWPPRDAAALMRREFAERRIDVAHTHSEMFAALAGVRAARDLGLPIVHTMHGRVDVYTTSVLPLPRVTVPLLAALHARHISHRGLRVRPDSPYTATPAARSMWRLMLAQSRASDHVIVPSTHFARKLTQQGVQTPISVVPNGLESSVLDRIGAPLERRLSPGETLRLMWVGRLSPEKRPTVLADAARTFARDVAVDVYGDGLSRRSIERRGSRLALHGSVSQQEVLDAMRASHLLVSSSYDFDNQPMVMLEAAASGLPVLFCDPDLGEVVPPGGGFLTDTPDAAGISALVARIRREPHMITAASAAMIRGRAQIEQRVDPMIAVYESAMSTG